MHADHTIGRLRLAALDRMDALPRDLREVAHEIGLPIVEAFMQAGVAKASSMRHIARMFWTNANGQHESRTGAATHLDVMLARSGGCPNSDALASLLSSVGVALVSVAPTARMVRASIEEIGNHGIVSKERKHCLRLKAAIAEGRREMWPRVFGDA